MAGVPPQTLMTLRHLEVLGGVPMVGLMYLLTLGMDDDKVSEVAKIWKQLARDLDTPVELLDRIPAASRQGWIADDQREFSRVTGEMHAGTEALRDSLDKVGDSLEAVVFAFRLFKGAMVTLGAVLIPPITALVPMALVPATAAQAHASLRWLAYAADKAVTVMIGALWASVAAQLAAIGIMKWEQRQLDQLADFHFPDGVPSSRLQDVDFAHVKIDARKFPTFQPPDRGDELPDAAKDFAWVAPAKPAAEPSED